MKERRLQAGCQIVQFAIMYFISLMYAFLRGHLIMTIKIVKKEGTVIVINKIAILTMIIMLIIKVHHGMVLP